MLPLFATSIKILSGAPPTPAPEVADVVPGSGKALGGTAVTISGSYFTDASDVTFGGVSATSIVVVDDSTITCVTPPGTKGTTSVVVTTPAGSNGVNTEFTYVTSLAEQLSAPYANVFAGSFTDDYFFSTTGFYGSMRVKDTGTPANDYDNSPRATGAASKISVTASNLKTVRRPDGHLDFAPHNIALQSNDVSSASWAKVGTCTATGTTVLNFPASGDRVQQLPSIGNCVGRNLIFSAVLSGTGTMTLTVYEGGPVTNLQVTLTGTPTRYSVMRSITETATDVRLWIQRAVGDTATSVTVSDILCNASWHQTTPGPFIRTTTAAVYEPPMEWDAAGNLIGARFEEARTNLCLRNCDLTNAAWTKTNMNTARTATGPNNRANFATTLTATAANATVTQSITSASQPRRSGFWVKRRTGTGVVEITQDNVAWSPVTVTANWTLVESSTVTSANPVVGLRIVTSGDEIDVCFFHHEAITGIVEITSPIFTVAASVTRAIDNFTTAISNAPAISAAATIYAHFVPLAINATAASIIFSIGVTVSNYIGIGRRSTGNNLRGIVVSAGANTLVTESGTASLAGDKVAVAVALNDGQVSIDGVHGAVDNSTGIPGVAPTLIQYGAIAGGTIGLCGHLKSFLIVPTRLSQADINTLTTP